MKCCINQNKPSLIKEMVADNVEIEKLCVEIFQLDRTVFIVLHRKLST